MTSANYNLEKITRAGVWGGLREERHVRAWPQGHKQKTKAHATHKPRLEEKGTDAKSLCSGFLLVYFLKLRDNVMLHLILHRTWYSFLVYTTFRHLYTL